MVTDQDSISKQINSRPTMYVATTYVAVAYLVYNILSIVLDSASESLGLNNAEAGYLASMYMLGSGVCNIIAITWVRKINWKLWVGIGIIALAFTYYSALWVDYTGLLAVMFAIGFVSSIIISILYTCMADMKNSSAAFGFCIGTQVIIGGLSIYVLLKYIIPEYGFDGVMIFLALSSLILLPTLAWIPKRGVEETEDENAIKNNKISLESFNKFLLMGFAGMFIYFVGQIGIWSYFYGIGEGAGFDEDALATIFLVTLILSSVGGYSTGWISEKIDRRLVVIFAVMLGVVSVLILMTSMISNYWIISLAFLFYQISWTFVMPFFMSIIADNDTNGSFAPLIPACQLLGSAVGPAVAGNIIFDGDYTWVFVLAIVSVLIAMALFVGVDTLKAKQKNSELTTN